MKKIILCLLFIFLNACDDAKTPFSPLAEEAVILAFGDSLTYSLGTDRQTTYPAILAKLSHRKVINEGISGEISQAGLQRLPKLLDKYKPQMLILIHGGNDILRNIPRKKTIENLRQMIALAKQREINVVMLGVPSFSLLNLKSAEIYQQVAQSEMIPIDLDTLPTILSSAALKSDRVHPNTAGYQKMAEAVYTLLQDNGAL
ncbi:MAG: GDSL-type esterase/lipase family protein [Methylococcales bacterium]|nr:GDSL-type esterase/lipase family protein [Methylococcales bacterium]